jgi:hypothetical protein
MPTRSVASVPEVTLTAGPGCVRAVDLLDDNYIGGSISRSKVISPAASSM